VRSILPLGAHPNPLYNSHIPMIENRPFKLKLKELCQLSDANWAAWINYRDEKWCVISDSIPGFHRKKVEKYINSSSMRKWLLSDLPNKRTRKWRILNNDDLKGKKLLLILVQGGHQNAIVIGTENITPQSMYLWETAGFVLEGMLHEDDLSRTNQDALMELENIQQELQARVAAQQAAESRLIQTTKLAAVGEMAAGVAHELNNPLTTVVGFSELVLSSLPPGSPQRADLELVLKEARRARDVVRRLLDFSRQSETIRVKADLNEIVLDVLSLMQHLIQINGISIRTEFEVNLPWVMIDRNQMKQVFLNLLHNALNAMPDGGNLEINTNRKIRYGTQYIAVGIKDSGVGIPPENLPRIFEPFFTTRAGQGGTGLGLSVTYGIVSEHGGTIEAESTPGSGSIFTVFIPIEVKQ
jgi:signal transduction histidine kinase